MQKKNQYLDLVNQAKNLEINYLDHMNTVAEVIDDSYDKLTGNECRALGILLNMVMILDSTEDMDGDERYEALQTLVGDYVKARHDVLGEVMVVRRTDTALLESAQLSANQKH